MAQMQFPEQPWPTGKVEQIEPLVGRVLASNASPYTYTGTQTYLVGGTAGMAVIDPGPDDADHLAALKAAIGDAKVIAIMCTHTHRDHSPAAAPLAKATGAPIIGCAQVVAQSAEGHMEAAYDMDYRPDRVLADGEQVCGPTDGPAWTLTAVFTPGHISNHLCFALEEPGTGKTPALFTGDHVMGWSTTVILPPDGDMGDYFASLDKIYQRNDRIYYPAHGPPVLKPRQLVRSTIGHRRQRERQIVRLLGDQAQSILDLVARMYKGLDERLQPAAAMSVWAHLLDLERRGEVSLSGDIWAST